MYAMYNVKKVSFYTFYLYSIKNILQVVIFSYMFQAKIITYIVHS